MILDIMVLLIIVMPIPALYASISRRIRPYTAVGYGVLSAGIGVLLVFAVSYSMGNSLGLQVEKYIEYAVKMITSSSEALESLGLSDLSETEATTALKEAYSMIASMLPSVLLIFGAVISYLEYNILVRIRYSRTNMYRPYAYIRNIALRNNDVMGWFLIYLVAYLLKFAGFTMADAAIVNVNILVENIICLQGISLIFLYMHVSKRSKILSVILSVVLWFMPMGRNVLMMLGLFDLLLNIRGRITSGKRQ